MLPATMRLLHGGNDRVLAPNCFGVKVRVLVPQVLFQLRIEPEPQRTLGALERFHLSIVAPGATLEDPLPRSLSDPIVVPLPSGRG